MRAHSDNLRHDSVVRLDRELAHTAEPPGIALGRLLDDEVDRCGPHLRYSNGCTVGFAAQPPHGPLESVDGD